MILAWTSKNVIANTSGLDAFLDAHSHGMKQKLVIISALIQVPKLIIMDQSFVSMGQDWLYLALRNLIELMQLDVEQLRYLY